MARRKAKVVKLPSARRDVLEIADSLSRHSLAVADRFLAATERTFARLAKMPRSGALFESDHPGLGGLRCNPVAGFRRYLIFYRPIDGGIEVLHV